MAERARRGRATARASVPGGGDGGRPRRSAGLGGEAAAAVALGAPARVARRRRRRAARAGARAASARLGIAVAAKSCSLRCPPACCGRSRANGSCRGPCIALSFASQFPPALIGPDPPGATGAADRLPIKLRAKTAPAAARDSICNPISSSHKVRREPGPRRGIATRSRNAAYRRTTGAGCLGRSVWGSSVQGIWRFLSPYRRRPRKTLLFTRKRGRRSHGGGP